jgi:hypothetical protein
MKNVNIKLEQLLNAVQRSLEYLIEERGVESICLNEDFYWAINEKCIYDISKVPSRTDMQIGSLCDEWGFIETFLSSNEIPAKYQLTEIAAILRYVGQVSIPESQGPAS